MSEFKLLVGKKVDTYFMSNGVSVYKNAVIDIFPIRSLAISVEMNEEVLVHKKKYRNIIVEQNLNCFVSNEIEAIDYLGQNNCYASGLLIDKYPNSIKLPELDGTIRSVRFVNLKRDESLTSILIEFEKLNGIIISRYDSRPEFIELSIIKEGQLNDYINDILESDEFIFE